MNSPEKKKRGPRKKPVGGKLSDAPIGCVAACRGADHARGCATYDKLLPQARRQTNREEWKADPQDRRSTVAYVGSPDMIRQSKFTETTRSFVLPQAIMKALSVLKEGNFRVRKDIDPSLAAPVKELAAFSLERLVFVASGKVHKNKAGSVLKAAAILRQETCDPLVTKTELDATFSLASMVAEATKQNTPKMQSAGDAISVLNHEKQEDHRIALLKGECEDA